MSYTSREIAHLLKAPFIIIIIIIIIIINNNNNNELLVRHISLK